MPVVTSIFTHQHPKTKSDSRLLALCDAYQLTSHGAFGQTTQPLVLKSPPRPGSPRGRLPRPSPASEAPLWRVKSLANGKQSISIALKHLAGWVVGSLHIHHWQISPLVAYQSDPIWRFHQFLPVAHWSRILQVLMPSPILGLPLLGHLLLKLEPQALAASRYEPCQDFIYTYLMFYAIKCQTMALDHDYGHFDPFGPFYKHTTPCSNLENPQRPPLATAKGTDAMACAPWPCWRGGRSDSGGGTVRTLVLGWPREVS